MKSSGFGIRPQDILILLKLVVWRNRDWRQMDLARELDLSQAEIAHALERLRVAGLLDDSKKKVQRLAAIEFLVHAVRYIMPPEFGSYVRGMPTASYAKPLIGKIVGDENFPWVWPSENGNERGLSIIPIYPSVPFAAEKDPLLYELLAIVDAIRAGKAREKKLAENEIRKRLLGSST